MNPTGPCSTTTAILFRFLAATTGTSNPFSPDGPAMQWNRRHGPSPLGLRSNKAGSPSTSGDRKPVKLIFQKKLAPDRENFPSFRHSLEPRRSRDHSRLSAPRTICTSPATNHLQFRTRSHNHSWRGTWSVFSGRPTSVGPPRPLAFSTSDPASALFYRGRGIFQRPPRQSSGSTPHAEPQVVLWRQPINVGLALIAQPARRHDHHHIAIYVCSISTGMSRVYLPRPLRFSAPSMKARIIAIAQNCSLPYRPFDNEILFNLNRRALNQVGIPRSLHKAWSAISPLTTKNARIIHSRQARFDRDADVWLSHAGCLGPTDDDPHPASRPADPPSAAALIETNDVPCPPPPHSRNFFPSFRRRSSGGRVCRPKSIDAPGRMVPEGRPHPEGYSLP